MADRCTSSEFVDELANKFNLHKKEEDQAAVKMIDDCVPSLALSYAQKRVLEQKQLKAQSEGTAIPQSADGKTETDGRDLTRAMMLAPQMAGPAVEELKEKIGKRMKELEKQ